MHDKRGTRPKLHVSERRRISEFLRTNRLIQPQCEGGSKFCLKFEDSKKRERRGGAERERSQGGELRRVKGGTVSGRQERAERAGEMRK